MRYYLFVFFTVLLFFLVSSCKKYSPAPDAFFITSNPVSVTTTSVQGSESNKITDLFLYVNGKFQGAYPVGNTMPVVTKNSSVKIDVFAGIKNNGMKDRSTTWLLYDKITFDTLVESGKTIERPFTFKYNPNVKFLWLENFDAQIGFSLVKSSGSDTTFKIAAPENSFEGKSAELGLTGTELKIAKVQSSTSFTLPVGNSNVYLELNYKGDSEFAVGVTDGVNEKFALIVNPQSNWNKIYIQLAEAIGTPPNAPNDAYKIFFRIIKPNGTESARVWLDNIKLVYL